MFRFPSKPRVLAIVLLMLAAMTFPALAPVPAAAQSAAAQGAQVAVPALPEQLTPETVRELVARLSDDEVRALLLARLDAVASQQAAQPERSFASRVADTWAAVTANWVEVVRDVPEIVTIQARAFSTFAERFGPGGLAELFGKMLLVLVIAYALDRLTVFLVRRRQGTVTAPADGDLWGAVRFLVRRLLRELLGLGVFYAALVIVGGRILTAEQITFAAPFVFYLIWIPRLGAALSRFTLAPRETEMRLVNVNDHWARFLYRNLIGLSLLIGFILFILDFNTRNGVSLNDLYLGSWLNLAIHIYIVVIAWVAREGLREMMLGSDPDRTAFDIRVANAYPVFAIAVSAVMWLVVQIIVAQGDARLIKLLLTGPSYVTMFWLLAAPALDTLIRGLVRHLQPPMIGTGDVAEAAYRATKRSYIRIGRVVAGIFVILMIARAWNLDLKTVIATGVGENLGGAVVEFLMILAIGYIVNELVALWINRRLAREQTTRQDHAAETGGEGGGQGQTRLATVLPLLRITAQTAIAVVFGLLALGALGINITPLLAGAGVVGLAIGFGAQKLVADIVSGIFFLIDDAFRIGEYVDVGGTTGTVERISIRSMQLRHHRGPVHTIPYGEIQKLTNYSRDWVIMKLKFTVPFGTDPNKIKKIFKKIGAEMMEDPLYKDSFLEPFKSQGVFDIDDVGMIIRGKFMAKPGEQFTLRKEIYNRVNKAFAENGIEFARREVRVAIPGLDEAEHLSEREKETIAGAAAQAVQQQVEAQQEAVPQQQSGRK